MELSGWCWWWWSWCWYWWYVEFFVIDIIIIEKEGCKGECEWREILISLPSHEPLLANTAYTIDNEDDENATSSTSLLSSLSGHFLLHFLRHFFVTLFWHFCHGLIWSVADHHRVVSNAQVDWVGWTTSLLRAPLIIIQRKCLPLVGILCRAGSEIVPTKLVSKI